MNERAEPPPGYRTQSPDTSYWAERILIEHWRGLQPWEKVLRMADLSRAAHEWHIAGLRIRHPRATEEELELRAAALRLGDDVIQRLTGFDGSR